MEEPWHWQTIGLATLFIILIIVTVVGNVLIIAAVLTTRRLRTVTNCFVMSLALADWIVGIFVMPLAVTKHLSDGKWLLGQAVCIVWVFCDVCVCTASILNLCAISIDRYFAVTQPLKYTQRRRSKRLAAFMILCVWLTAVLITLPPLIWFRHETPFLNISNSSNSSNVSVPCDYSENKGYVVFSAMGSFFVPLAVMLYVYASISCVIAKRHDNLEAMNNVQQVKWPLNPHKLGRKPEVNLEESDLARESSDTDEVVKIASVMTKLPENQSRLPERRLRYSDSGSRGVSRRENKAAQTLSIVVGGFIACWLLFFVAYISGPFLPKNFIPPTVMMLLTWLGWINSAINPFIYAFYSPDFRLAFWRLTVRHFAPRPVPCHQMHSTSRQSMHMRDSMGGPRP